jgi:PAS domain S-box-containing protein
MDWLSLFGLPGVAILVALGLWLLLRGPREDLSDAPQPDHDLTHLSRLLGYEPADMRGAFSLEAVHSEDRARVGRIWADLVEDPGRVTTFRYRVRREDGSWSWTEATAANLRDEPTIQAVVINRRDITAEIETQRLLEEQVAVRTRELQSLYRADEALRRSLQVDDVLQALVNVACDVLGADKSAVLVRVDQYSPVTALRAARGFDTSLLGVLSTALEADVGAAVITTAQPCAMSIRHESGESSGELTTLLATQGVCDLLGVPITMDDQVFAVFNIFYTRPHDFHETERRLMMALAQRAGLALENARLYEAARGKAALEERQRLARELHDSVSQALYAIGLNTTVAQKLLLPDPARVDGLLKDILRLTETGLAEMRSLIFELRPESLATEGLVGALEKQAAAVRARHRLVVETTLCDEPDVSLQTKEVIYRIAQEALHNTAKHAHARGATIALEISNDELVLRLSDDGTGFETTSQFPGHLGLHSMRERAVAVGAALAIESAPGQGTRIWLRVPLGSGNGALAGRPGASNQSKLASGSRRR